ncbi:MAG: type I glyceraldehyde-3-phosphate dehydrogenase [Candidatus Woesearchaeota archaeon]
MTNIAINGFGRIGRMAMRILAQRDVQVVAINDITDTKTLAHLLKHDSAQGKFNGTVSYDENSLTINKKKIPVYAIRNPEELPWKQLDVDVVIECTGLFTKRESAQKHLHAGAKAVMISAPSNDADVVIVKGINEHELTQEHKIISNASCTTNCLAPIVKVLDDNFGIERGFMTTVHAYTADQRLQDSPHKDLRRARAAAVNIVPTSTGAAKAVAQVLPHLKGKLDGIALRVPTPVGSITDFVCEVKKHTTIEEIKALLSNVAQHHLQGIIEYSEDPLVSTDIIGNTNSCIVDGTLTNVIGGNLLKIVAWYDNEWGYANRLVDVTLLVAHKQRV